MNCSRCGLPLPEGNNFCMYCGNPVSVAQNNAIPQSMPAQQPVQGYPQPAQSIPQPVQNYQQPMQGYPQPVQGYQQPMQGYPQPVQGYPQPVQGYPQQMYGMAQPWQPQKRVKKKFSITDPATLVTLAGCLLLFISIFLPFVEFWGEKGYLVNSDKVIHIVLVGLVLVFLFTNLKIGAFVSTLVEGFMCLADIGIVLERIENSYRLADKTSGYYMMIVGMIILLSGGIWLMCTRYEKQR